MVTLRGTAHGDRLAGHGDDSYKLIGLQGNDTYTLRLFQVDIHQPYGDPTRVVYLRDDVSEAAGGGYDTVRLENHYENVGFTGITPSGFVSASELANVEHIVAAQTTRGTRLISWNITAGREDNVIDAPGSADTLAGGAGNDRINAGGGNDTLIGGLGRDTLNGGSGTDTASYAAERAPVVVDLGAGTSSAQDRFISIEAVIGTSRSDRIYGSGGDNTLAGGDGNDRLSGNGGDDTLLGGNGGDTLTGGSGDDAIHSGGGNDLMTGNGGHDRFVFDFSTRQVVESGHVHFTRTVFFHDTITDFEDGRDKIVLAGDGPLLSGISLPGLSDVTIRQSGQDTIVYFGDPTHSGPQNAPHEVYFGTLTLKHFDASHLSYADFLTV